MPQTKKKTTTPTIGVRDIEAGHEIKIGGEWRIVVTVEPHETLDAYRELHTADGRRWVRSIFDSMGVKTTDGN